MRKTVAALLVLLLLCPLVSSYASEVIDGRQLYAEQVLAQPDGFGPLAAMASTPDGAIVAIARAEGSESYSLLRWQDPAEAPEILPLSMSEAGDISAISFAPDGQMLALLAFARRMGGQSAPAPAAGGGQQGGQTRQAGAGAGGGQQMTTFDIDSQQTTLCWFDGEGNETARLNVPGVITRAEALTEQRAAVLNAMEGVTVYDSQGKELSRIGGAMQVFGMAISADSVYTLQDESIQEWSLEDGSNLRSIPLSVSYSTKAAVGPDGALYGADTQGIYRVGKEEAQATLIMGAIGTLIGDPANSVSSLAILPDGRIAALLTEGSSGLSGGGGMMMMQIGGEQGGTQLALYTKVEGSVEDRQPFVITSLYDSTRLRKAVSEFQRAHPELAVELKVQVPSSNSRSGAPIEDYIRALNTELLAGRGGDVIILDSLPMRKYIDKGILADISHLVPELGLLPGIAEGSKSADGSVYAIPAQFTFQTLWGRSDVMDGIKTLEDIPYAQLSGDQRPMYGRTPEEWINLTYPTSEAAFRDENGLIKFDSEAFERYLETLYQLYSEQAEMAGQDVQGMRRAGGGSPDEMLAMINGVVAMYPTRVSSLMQLNMAYTVAGAEEGRGIILPSINGDGYAYVPGILAGVNAQSAQRENAEAFIRLLLSDVVQSSDQMSGLPTSSAALDTMFAEAIERSQEEGLSFSAVIRIAGGASINMTEPDEATLLALRESCDALNTPVLTDETILSFIIEETGRFFEGTGTAQDAARAIEQRAWYYQNE